MSNILKIAASGVEAAAPTNYQIERSLRFNSADSAYLNRTPGAGTSDRIMTFSFWVKRGKLNAGSDFNYIYDGGAWQSNAEAPILFTGNSGAVNCLDIHKWNGSSLDWILVTNQVFRDVSSWYHIVIAFDTTQATASDRIKVYVNGERIPPGSFSTETYPTQNSDTKFNATSIQKFIGRQVTLGRYYDGLLAEFLFIDGQALTPSDFGETDATTGVWKPKAYAGTYGTNGFYLDFSDNSSTTALGYDAAGSNDWTPNNFSVTAGAGNDSLVDTPTNYGTDTGAGGEVRGNYATLNPLAKGTNVVVSNGGLDYTAPNSASSFGSVISTIGMSSGKWYCEYVWTSGASNSHIGVATNALNLNTYLGGSAAGYSYYASGLKYNNASSTAYGASYSTGDVIGVAFDADAGTLTFYKNNVSQGVAFTGLTNGPYFFGIGMGDAGQTATINFGQRPFAYTAPSGFKALCTQNLPTPTVVQGDDYFNTVLYTGNGSTQSITGVGFQPDLVWIKGRSLVSDNRLHDAVRGAEQTLTANSTAAESVDSGVRLTSLDSDGFSVGSSTFYNNNTSTFVAWNWNAGGSNATNTDGTITSTVRANTTAGFSIVSYTGTGTGSDTVGHGLNQAPEIIIIKDRDNAEDWSVYTTAIDGSYDYLYLNLTNAKADSGWSAPTSSVFAASGGAGSGEKQIAYCFHSVEGFSKFGSYTGNGSTDGTFVYCGFRPAFVLYKSTVTAGSWSIFDASRDIDNAVVNSLSPNLSDAETSSGRASDFLSNGFKWRNTTYGNTANEVYIFMAFAENPFKYSLAR